MSLIPRKLRLTVLRFSHYVAYRAVADSRSRILSEPLPLCTACISSKFRASEVAADENHQHRGVTIWTRRQ